MKKRQPASYPNTDALAEWLGTEAGRRVIDGAAAGEYLYNRIRRAFLAGWNAAMKRAGKDEYGRPLGSDE